MHIQTVLIVGLSLCTGCSWVQSPETISQINKEIQLNPSASGSVNNRWVDTDLYHSVIIDMNNRDVLVADFSDNQKDNAEFVPLGFKGLSINAVARRTYILDIEGKLWVNGLNITGYIQIPIDNVVDFSGGFPYTYILDNMGSVYRWSADKPDELVNIDFPSIIVEIDGDLHHHVFLSADGDVYGIGLNSNGQLGLGHSNKVLRPTLLPLQGIAEISASQFNTVLTQMDGTVYIAGRSPYISGALNSLSFVSLDAANEVEKGYAGIDKTMVLYKDGSVEVIGWYRSKEYRSLTVLPISNVEYMDISGGADVFILSNGNVLMQ